MHSLLTTEAKRRFASLMPPSGMAEQVVAALRQAVVQRLQRRIGLLGSLFLSMVAYVFAQRSYFWQEIQTSSIAGWIRFALSDPDIVVHSLRAYLAGVLEAIPYMTVLVVLLGLFLLTLLGSLLVSLSKANMQKPLPSRHFSIQ